MVLNGFTGLLRQAKFLLNKNSTTILTSMGVAGTVSTAVLTGRASFKAAELIENKTPTYVLNSEGEFIYKDESKDGEGWKPVEDKFPLSKIDKVKLVWYLYLPPVAAGTVTVAAIVFAHRIDAKKIAALTVASGISERALQEYKTKVIEKLGERQNTKIRDEIAQDQVNAHPKAEGVVVVGGGEVLCYDEFTGRYFYSTVEAIKRAENKLNHDILNHMGASLSEFHSEIGLEPTNNTEMVGWNPDNLIEVVFSTVLTKDEKPCLVVGFNYPPTVTYMQLH